MNDYSGYYPNFDVMKEKTHWDDHTREIVEKRLHTGESMCQFFNEKEVAALFDLYVVLLDDSRLSIISFVIHHFDRKLASDIGEAQRKKGTPKESILIREGLHLLNQVCLQIYKNSFGQLADETKKKVINNMLQGNIQLQSGQKSVPVKDFIKKVLNEAVSAYYSHPVVWSEIGYAGPAYPRGYVRSEWGLTDPWEAKRDK